MKRIVIDNGDGTVKVLNPSPQLVLTLAVDMSEDEALAFIAEKDGGGKPFEIVNSVPNDRTFRAAWKPHSNGVEVDMPRAQIIHMGKIREKRDEKLKVLDVETLKGNDVQAQKQVLRDLPATFDLTTATTPEELKALWPSELEAE